jgi:hypothetical protein
MLEVGLNWVSRLFCLYLIMQLFLVFVVVLVFKWFLLLICLYFTRREPII